MLATDGSAGSAQPEVEHVLVKQQADEPVQQDVSAFHDNASSLSSIAEHRNTSPQQSSDSKPLTQPSAAQDANMEEEVLAVGPFNFSKSRLEAMAQSVLSDEREEGANTGSDRSKAARKALLNAGKQSTSHYKGVNRHSRSNRWEAHIWDGRQLHLGCFDNELQAAAAYDIVALKIRGPKAGLNFPVRHYQEEIQHLEVMPLEQLVTMVRASRRNQIITNRLRARRRSSGCYYSTGDSLPLFPPEAANDPRPRPLRLSKPLGSAPPAAGGAATPSYSAGDPSAPQQRPTLPSGSGASPIKKRRPSADVYDSLIPPAGFPSLALSTSPHGSHAYLGTPSPCITPTASSANLHAPSYPAHGLPPRSRGSFRRHSVASYAPSPDPTALPIYQFQSRPFEPILPPMPADGPLQLPIEHLSIGGAGAEDMRLTPDPAVSGPPAVTLEELDALPSLIGGPSMVLAPGGPQQVQATAGGDPVLQDLMNTWRQPVGSGGMAHHAHHQQQQAAAAAHLAQQQQQAAAAAAYDAYSGGYGSRSLISGLGAGGGVVPQALRAQLQRQLQLQNGGDGTALHHAALGGGPARATLPSAAPGGGLPALPSWPPLARTAGEAMQWEALNLATTAAAGDALTFRSQHLEQHAPLDDFHAAGGQAPSASASGAAPATSATSSGGGNSSSSTGVSARRRSPFFPPAPEGDSPSVGSHLLGGPAGQDLHTMAAPASSAPFDASLRQTLADLATSKGLPASNGAASAGAWDLDPLAEENVEALEVMMVAAAQAVDRKQQQQQWRAQMQQHLVSTGGADGLEGGMGGTWLGGGGAGSMMSQVAHHQQQAFQPPLTWQDL